MRAYRLLTIALGIGAFALVPRTASAQDFAVTLTGDSIITHRLSVHKPDTRFMGVVNAVRDGDVAFTNLEILFHNYEAPPAAQSGGTWLRAEPALFKELQWIGFNLFGAANNHSLDYGIEGLRNHRRVLAEAGAAFAGINPLRYRTRYRVDAAEFAAVRKMKADLKLDAVNALARTKPDTPQRVNFLNQTFELAETPPVITEPDPRDLKGLIEAIGNARRMADYVVVSVHAHEGAPGSREVPAQFLVDFAHTAVEAGADIFVGHGPHVLRGIEIFNGKVIFYSLANFIFQNDTVALLPADLYEQYGLRPDALPADLFETRSDHDRHGFAADPLYWESAVARVAFRNGRPAEVRLTTITLGFGRSRWQRGRPEAADQEASTKILARLQKLSQVSGTKITVREGRGVFTVER